MTSETKRIGNTTINITLVDSIYQTGKTRIIGFISGNRNGAFMVYDGENANKALKKMVTEY